MRVPDEEYIETDLPGDEGTINKTTHCYSSDYPSLTKQQSTLLTKQTKRDDASFMMGSSLETDRQIC